MKQFFEQYGGVALGILALLVLIAMITPVGNIIKTSLQGTTEKFSTQINAQTDTMSAQMKETFDEASAERYYDDSGNRLNGIVDNALYVDGIRYQNLWDREANESVLRCCIESYTLLENGYHFIASGSDAYFGAVTNEATGNTNKYNPVQGQLYEFKEGKDYIFYATNTNKNYIMKFDSNLNSISPNQGNGHYDGITRKARITKSNDNESTFALRVGIEPATAGSEYTINVYVFEIPSDLQIDLSSL